MATLVTVSTPEPVFFKVTGAGLLTVPIACDPKFIAGGVKLPPGAGGVVFSSMNSPAGGPEKEESSSIAMSGF
jgi:hypothetical protein